MAASNINKFLPEPNHNDPDHSVGDLPRAVGPVSTQTQLSRLQPEALESRNEVCKHHRTAMSTTQAVRQNGNTCSSTNFFSLSCKTLDQHLHGCGLPLCFFCGSFFA